MKKGLIVIGGPTATGKTALSVAVAKAIDGEIVSADSMQIYRGMDVGTAKVRREEMCGVPHHMIDVAEPTDAYSVAEYQRMATEAIEDILARGKTPIVVGGTGLYINSVLFPMQFREFDPEIRRQVAEMYRTHGNEYMYALLQGKDPDRAAKLFPNDVKRVARALELCLSGTTHSEGDLTKEAVYDYRMYVLSGDRAAIYERIDRRVDMMLEAGLLDEIRGLLAAGVGRDAQSFQAIAYKEFAEYLAGERGYQETVELVKRRSRNYAKRQLTWFRQYNDAVWLDYATPDDNIERIVYDAKH